jgi:hypothetical protein
MSRADHLRFVLPQHFSQISHDPSMIRILVERKVGELPMLSAALAIHG